MRTIIEILRDKQISYYQSKIEFQTIQNNPVKFIMDYIQYGDKSWHEFNGLSDRASLKSKLIHTCYIYLLGLSLYYECDLLKCRIDSQLKAEESLTEDNTNNFLYYWFLVCIFHDFGYVAVTDKKSDYRLFDEFVRSKVIDKIENELKHISSISNVIPSVLSENIIKYHKYRIDNARHEFVDHGIFSGAYFIWNRRVEFEKKIKNGELTLIDQDKKVYIDKRTNLRWSDEILNVIHSQVSQIIAGHNMFFIKENEDSSEYKKHGLDKLISSTPVYNPNDFPIFYLLCLVDTIDIYKFITYKKYDNKKCECKTEGGEFSKILSEIKFSIHKFSLTIDFGNDYTEMESDYFKRMSDQKYWLPIDVCNNKITMKL